MADTEYKYKSLKFTSDEIEAKLDLIEGNGASAKINAGEVTTSNGTLATEAFVEDYVAAKIQAGNSVPTELASGTLYIVYDEG